MNYLLLLIDLLGQNFDIIWHWEYQEIEWKKEKNKCYSYWFTGCQEQFIFLSKNQYERNIVVSSMRCNQIVWEMPIFGSQ